MSALRFRVLPGEFAVSRLPRELTVPAQPAHSFHCELFSGGWRTLYGLAQHAPPVGAQIQVESGWALLELDGSFAFDVVGVMARWTAPLAHAGIALMALSSFDTDYLLVKHTRLADALAAWSADGIHPLD